MASPRMARSTSIVVGIALLWTMAAANAGAAKPLTPAQKCSAAKRAAAGKELACRLSCTAKATIKGLPSDDPSLATCLAACSTRFTAAFAKAEHKGGCQTTNDAGNVETDLDAFLATLEETTYSQGEWGTPSLAATELLEDFDTVYASTGGIVTGGLVGGITMIFTDGPSVMAYLPQIGPPGPLNGNTLNPISTPAGVFGGDVTALQLNVDFSDARALGTLATPFGDLALCNVGALRLNGTTVRQFLGIVNTLLGGGSSPFSIADLEPVTAQLNGSFDGGVPTAFARDHLVNGACVCPSPTIDCNGVCIDPTTDAANCGSCGNACGSNEVCSGSACTCAAPHALCGTQCNVRPCQCVDLQNDADNCGSCGHPCASHVCSGGVCQ
jgi:hypothetical protein